METKTIKEIAEILRTGKTPPTSQVKYFDGKINWYTPGDLDKTKYLGTSKRTISHIALDDKKAVTFPPNTLLLGCIGDIGKLGITSDLASSNQQLTGIYPKNDTSVDYLFYWFLGNKKRLDQYTNNAVVPILNNRSLEQVKIPLPPLAEQKKIATLLDAADAYRQKTKQLITHYDKLAQSLFLDMFGDPYVNQNKHPYKKLKSLISSKSDLVDGPFGSSINTKVDYIDNGEIPVIRTKNITPDNVFITNDLKFMRRAKYETLIRSQVLPGDIILTKVGTIGNVCIFPDIFPEAILSTTGSCRIRLNELVINKKYFLRYLNFYKPKMLEIASAGVQAFLNMTHIKGFDILYPPLQLQNQFAERIQAIELQKSAAKKSLQQAEDLFNSLLQKAFKGEL